MARASRTGQVTTAMVLLLMLLAGCANPTADEAPRDYDFAAAIVLDHDHNNHALHTASHGLQAMSWSTLGQELGIQGFANFVFHQRSPGDAANLDAPLLAFVAVDGDTRGGFVIADITTPFDIAVLGSYFIEGNSVQEVRVSPDGNWAIMNVQDLSPSGTDCTVCIHVVDVSNRAAPRLSSVFPVELLGTHNFDFHVIDGQLYVFYVGQPLYLPYPDPGNRIGIARFVEASGEATLVPVGHMEHNEVNRDGRSFPHDVMVQRHPDGRTLAYGSYWDGGHVIFDVSNPSFPEKLSVFAEAAPSDELAVHWIRQEDAARADGRVLAWSAPEIGILETGTGVVRGLDVTDPSAPVQLGTWTLPGELEIPGAYMLSPHTVIPHPTRDLVAVSHYHAGVWILDTTDPSQPQAVAFYQPHGDEAAPFEGDIWWKKPNFNPTGYGPNVYQSRWDPRDPSILWVTDRGTGLYALSFEL